MARPELKRTIAEGAHLRFVARGQWEWVERVAARAGVVLVPITADRKLVLVEQYRPPVGKRTIELPAGLVGDSAERRDEHLEDAARRELLEETGYEAGEMKRLFSGVLAAGLSDEINVFFLATDLRRRTTGGGDSQEAITVHEIPIETCHAWLMQQHDTGAAIDAKIYAGLLFAGAKPPV
jgi:ADP-ribose pyrophosphatase